MSETKPHQGSFLVPKDEASREFLLTRGSAIEHYAMVEQSLLMIFAHLLGTPKDAAGVVFFRINNARARLEMLEKLLNKKYGNTYNVFWHSVHKELKTLDGERNKIVHRIIETTTTSTRGKGTEISVLLVGPNYSDRTANSESISLANLHEFILKSHFYAHITLHFCYRSLLKSKPLDGAWPDIFQQPVTYPPHRSHPLFQTFG